MAKPKDMSEIPGYGTDKRTMSNLVNDQNITVDEGNMWMAPFCPGRAHTITITWDRE
jgi:hypothetical protein